MGSSPIPGTTGGFRLSEAFRFAGGKIYPFRAALEAEIFLSMRKCTLIWPLLLCTFSVFGQKKSTSPAAASAVFDLSDAVKQNLVAVTVTGTGGYSGPSLKITCRNLRGKFLRLRIPQGQFMEPSDSTFQTLVVSGEQTLAVGTKTPAEAILSTFCSQAGDRSPVSGAAFAIGAMAPGQLCKLLKFMAEKGKIDSPAAQTAVWCLTSNEPLGSIDDPELAKFTAELLGRAAPGYKIKRQTEEVVPGDRAATGKALVVEGNFQYALAKDEKVLMNLLRADGTLIKQLSKEETMKAGEHRSGLRLEVWNLPPGKYIVRMQTKDGRVIRDMEVEF